MNYRHAYHAGNHGDVLKHVLLSRILVHYMEKQAAFGVIDAHAGIGVYDLAGLEAFKTGEWKDGIGRLLRAQLSPPVASALEPYLSVVRALNPGGELQFYPGSPEIARRMLRKQDRLLLNELHPQDHETLSARFGSEQGIRVENIDALQCVKASLPFPQKRGVLLVDPPYEVTDEMDRVSRIVGQALRRMANLCVMIWYPVTTQDYADRFCAALPLTGVKGALRAEILVRPPKSEGGMAGSGLVIVNPPWKLFDDCQPILPELTRLLSVSGQHLLRWIVEPT
jgi:23S rRNA (adenine2030-N6)-methyltransferase